MQKQTWAYCKQYIYSMLMMFTILLFEYIPFMDFVWCKSAVRTALYNPGRKTCYIFSMIYLWMKIN